MLRHIAALIFIFICTTVAWVILGSTILYRTHDSDQQLRGRVGSTWGVPQEQTPPTATYSKTELIPSTTIEDGKTIIRNNKTERYLGLPLESSGVNVSIQLDPRRKGLLWYSTYQVEYAGDYKFRNDSPQQQDVSFRLQFPTENALYDDVRFTINGAAVPLAVDAEGRTGNATLGPNQTAVLHVGYRSQGMESWRYKLAQGVAQVKDFNLAMRTNFRAIDFADDTLSPTSKQLTREGWELTWHYNDLVSGFPIGMTMPEKLQPGPLAGQISYFAPVSLFFFFFLMFIITTMRKIDLHPMNYFFLATAFFAFHLLLAYLVDHISIHAAMAIASLVSVTLVVSYLRLVVGVRFAALEAGTAQLIYLVLFSYAFFWKGFTGLAVTIISVITLFVVMQATGRVKWSEKFSRGSAAALANLG